MRIKRPVNSTRPKKTECFRNVVVGNVRGITGVTFLEIQDKIEKSGCPYRIYSLQSEHISRKCDDK